MTAELLTRLEQATEGSRELSDHVLLAVGWGLGRSDDEAHLNTLDLEERGFECWYPPNSQDWIQGHKRPCPTTSLDAALTLFPAGFGKLDIQFVENGHTYVARGEGLDPIYDSEGATFALALCIAALRARE